MNKFFKIGIVVFLVLIVVASSFILFLFKTSNTGERIVEKQEKEWENLKPDDSNTFLNNNFTSKLTQEIDVNSFFIYGNLNKQYHNENSRIIYAKDRTGVYMRSFCDELDYFVKIDKADPESFKILSNCYSKDRNNVYFTNIIVGGADPTTFKVIEENYSKDGGNIYFQQYMIVKANIDTFEITLNSQSMGYYSKDKNYIYKEHLAVTDLNARVVDKNEIEEEFFDCLNEDIDKNSLEVIDGNFIKDEEGVYFSVKGTGSFRYCDKIEGADSDSFEVINGLWTKDFDSIFHNSQEINGEDVDLETFEVVSDNFAKDLSNVYYQETVIEEADVETFTPISDNYSEDDENVYLDDEIVAGADVETFEVIVDDGDDQYAVDEDNVYEGDEVIENVDVETFDVEEYAQEEFAMSCLPDIIRDSINVASFMQVGACHAKDNSHVFFRFNCGQDCSYTEMQANSASFEEIQFNHSSDANNIYYLDSIISGADKQTFEVFDGAISYSRDYQHVYFRENIIIDADSATFSVISDNWNGGFFGRDKDYIYEGVEKLINDDIDTFVTSTPYEEGENCYYKKGLNALVEKICN